MQINKVENNLVENNSTKDLKQYLMLRKDVILSRLKIHNIGKDFGDFANDVMYSVSMSPKLQDCSVQSIVESACQLAKAGLSVGGNISFLVPFKDKCTFQIGYEGYGILLDRVVGVKYQKFEVVYENDTFDILPEIIKIDENGDFKTINRFTLTRAIEKKGAVKGAFAYIQLKNNDSHFKYMTVEELAKYKPKYDSVFWKDWGELMYGKQVYKILARSLIKSFPSGITPILDVVGQDETKEMTQNNAIKNIN